MFKYNPHLNFMTYGDSHLKEWYDKIEEAKSVESLEEIRISVLERKAFWLKSLLK